VCKVAFHPPGEGVEQREPQGQLLKNLNLFPARHVGSPFAETLLRSATSTLWLTVQEEMRPAQNKLVQFHAVPVKPTVPRFQERKEHPSFVLAGETNLV